MESSPWTITSLTLEAYRKRLITVLNLIDDAAYGTSEISSSAVSDAFDSVVDYLFDGEEAFNNAYALCKEAQEKGNQIEQLDAEILQKKQLISDKLMKLQKQKESLQNEISQGRTLLHKLYSARSVSFKPENVMQLVYRMDAGELPLDWKLALLHPEEYKAKEEARLAAESETGPALLPGRQARKSDESGMEEDVLLHPSPSNVQAVPKSTDFDSYPHPVQHVSSSTQDTIPISVSIASTAPTSTQPPIPAAPSAPGTSAISTSAILAIVAKLPPEGKAELLKYFPPGWKPGNPLPSNLPDPRALLAKYMNA